jgi:hypothetical protein
MDDNYLLHLRGTARSAVGRYLVETKEVFVAAHIAVARSMAPRAHTL